MSGRIILNSMYRNFKLLSQKDVYNGKKVLEAPCSHCMKYISFRTFYNSTSYKNGDSSQVQVQKSPVTPLLKQLQAKIKFSGPITIHDYMKEVLINPLSGYYTRKDNIFGSKGDYITSPDISQMFGEMLGIWIYNEWYKMGCCRPMHLVEFGPGQGALIEDILRTLKKIGMNISTDVTLHLVEISQSLCTAQQQRLCGIVSDDSDEEEENKTGAYRSSVTKDGTSVSWHRHLVGVPEGFTMYVAHEFFDALPIHKLYKTADGWRELLIDLDEESGPHHLKYVLSRHETPIVNIFTKEEDEEREDLEVCPEAVSLLSNITGRIERNGGAALIIDYGHDGTIGDTFRAFRSHKQVSPLLEPGTADLTADVDFSAFKNVIKDKLVCYGPVQQGFFLKNMGIELRLTQLLKDSSNKEHKDLVSGYRMLVEPQNMGERFKMFALFPHTMKEFLIRYPPAGFFRDVDK